MKVKTGEERKFVIFKDSLSMTISTEMSSRRNVFNDVVNRFVLKQKTKKTTKLRSSSVLPSYPKQVMDYLKQELVIVPGRH